MSKRFTAPAKLALSLAIALAVAALPALSAAKSCIDWPRLMAQYELELLPEGKAVLVTPFTNFTKKSEDDWLKKGIRDYIADMMRSSKNLKVLAGPTAKYGQVSTPDWKISGRFQRAGSELRIFVSLYEGASGKLKNQLELRFPYPGNKEFFERLAQASKDLMKAMDAKWDNGMLRKVSDATSSTGAFESYSKGRQILQDYNPKTAPKAESHFKDAIRLDYRSPLGYEGLVALNTFLGFYNKQMRHRFSSYYQKAEAELVKMTKLAKPAPAVFGYVSKKTQKKRGLHVKLDNRFLESNAAFMEALYASKLGNLEGAADALRRCVDLVPEDAVAWKHLARVYSQMGDVTKSGEALRKANEIDPCGG
jgi:predicted Zn-dependent protease